MARYNRDTKKWYAQQIRDELGNPGDRRPTEASGTLNKAELQALADRVGAEYEEGEGYNEGSTNAEIRASISREIPLARGTTAVDVPGSFDKRDQERILYHLRNEE